jgi:hypothetical protein
VAAGLGPRGAVPGPGPEDLTVSGFETVVIEPRGGHYVVAQGNEVLLAVPAAVFERYEAGAVFPPSWDGREESHPVRRLFWNPETAEFLMAGLGAHPVRTVEGAGSTPYRSFLQGFWVPSPPVLLMRPYWNPPDPYDPFDAEARRRSFHAQRRLLGILTGLLPPAGWSAILNATDPFLEAVGLDPAAAEADPEGIREVSLTPPGFLESGRVAEALEILATEHVGSLFPILREGVLAGVHALCLPALHAAQALFDRLGILHQEGPYRPH